ncbi:MAG: hypothetical protein ACYS7M_15305, partial [Planctomycetota bacterium]
YLGGVLDKPRATIQGTAHGLLDVLSEDPTPDFGGGLLNLLPDALTGMTDEAKIDEWEFAERIGMPENQPGFDRWDIPKLALGVAMDPLIWVAGPTARGMSSVGKTSAKLTKRLAAGAKGSPFGRTAANVAQQIRTGERAAVGLKVPFAKEPFAKLGSGGSGAKLAAGAIDKLFYSNLSPLSHLRAALSPATGGKWGETARLAGLEYAERKAQVDAILDFKSGLGETRDALQKQFGEVAEFHKAQGDEIAFGDFTRDIVETKGGLPGPEGITEALGRQMGAAGADNLDDLGRQMHGYLKSMLDSENAIHERILQLGGKSKVLEDAFVDHFGHRPIPSVIARSREKAKLAGSARTRFEFAQARRQAFKNYPGGAVGINRLSRDRVLWGLTEGDEGLVQVPKTLHRAGLKRVLQAAGVEPAGGKVGKIKELQKQYIQEIHVKPQLAEAVERGVVTMEEAAEHWQQFTEPFDMSRKISGRKVTVTQDRADELLRYFGKVPDDVRIEGYYGRKLTTDWYDYMVAAINYKSTLQSGHAYLGQPGVIRLPGAGREGGVALTKAWQDAGFKTEGLTKLVRDRFPDETAGLTDAKQLREFIGTLSVDSRTQGSLRALGQLEKRGVKNQFTEIIDRLKSVYQSYLFLPFAASHFRNRVGGLWNAWIDGRVSIKELYHADRAA